MRISPAFIPAVMIAGRGERWRGAWGGLITVTSTATVTAIGVLSVGDGETDRDEGRGREYDFMRCIFHGL